MRQHHVADDKLFVDYAGMRPSLTDPVTGEVTDVELFVGVLGASNYTPAEATYTQRVADFAGSLTRALTFIRGVPGAIVPDQLKSAVASSCRYEPGIQRTTAELGRHYGTTVLPARSKSPRDKAKVEVGVQVAERWLLPRIRNETFDNLGAFNARLAVLVADLDGRVMRTHEARRQDLSERLDRPALSPLPETPFEVSNTTAGVLPLVRCGHRSLPRAAGSAAPLAHALALFLRAHADIAAGLCRAQWHDNRPPRAHDLDLPPLARHSVATDVERFDAHAGEAGCELLFYWRSRRQAIIGRALLAEPARRLDVVDRPRDAAASDARLRAASRRGLIRDARPTAVRAAGSACRPPAAGASVAGGAAAGAGGCHATRPRRRGARRSGVARGLATCAGSSLATGTRRPRHAGAAQRGASLACGVLTTAAPKDKKKSDRNS